MNYFETEDFYFAAYLLFKGYKIKETSNINRVTQFKFDSSEEIMAELGIYHGAEGVVEPKQFGRCVRELKTVIYDMRERERIPIFANTHNR